MKVSKHAMERLVERNVKAQDAVDCLKGKRKSIQPNGSVRHWHDTLNLCVVVKDDTVITIMRKEW